MNCRNTSCTTASSWSTANAEEHRPASADGIVGDLLLLNRSIFRFPCQCFYLPKEPRGFARWLLHDACILAPRPVKITITRGGDLTWSL